MSKMAYDLIIFYDLEQWHTVFWITDPTWIKVKSTIWDTKYFYPCLSFGGENFRLIFELNWSENIW